ncbi:MAG: Na+/H+ antiporter NhaC family protein [Elusimicrobia bacterium]|nr:Na+/H+ antiporter NhaC family protein [Elusimicrobiota bacterium]
MLKRLYISLTVFCLAALLILIFGGHSALIGTSPLWPPAIAIALALITRDVLFSLFSGVWVGAALALKPANAFETVKATGIGLFTALDTHILKAVADSDHSSIILFTLVIGGTVGLIARSGGLEGFVSAIAKKVSSRVKVQLATWMMGIAIFFDDYSNCLIVGNMMRPLSDKFRISREKLSFIIDATAAPISSLLLVSTWIGFELGLIGDAMKASNIPGDAYIIFLHSIPYSFYLIIILLFIPLTIFMKRDFGSMLEAEQRAINENQPLRRGSTPLSESTDFDNGKKPEQRSAALAVVPIVVLVLAVIVGLVGSGLHELYAKGGEAIKDIGLRDILGNANSFKALLWASLASSLTALTLALAMKALSFKESMDAWFSGVKSMLMAVLVLSLAWAIGGVTKEIGTAQYVTQLLSGTLPIWALPAAIFVASASIAFATGTSWGTMAIIFPIAVPLAHKMALSANMPPEAAMHLLYATVGTVLSGSVFGDHCSPISDTTILSSIGSAVDHIDHVRTQMTYALTTAAVCLLIGYLPSGFGINPWILNISCLLIMAGLLYKVGTKLPDIEIN